MESQAANIGSRKLEMTSHGDLIFAEAYRCLNCFDAPCQKACPASIPIPDFIQSIKSHNFLRSAAIVRTANAMASVCGKICPEEVFCQTKCTRGRIDSPILIRQLHSFATGFEEQFPLVVSHDKKHVAIIGAGPAGLTCAARLALKGIHVVIFEASPKAGGVPNQTIPKFRLADNDIYSDLNYVQSIGVTIVPNSRIDDPLALLKDYDAVFIAVGLDTQKMLGIPCEDIHDIHTSLSFLETARAGKMHSLAGEKVVVIGGGNVSLDAASAATHLGAESVRLIYRRGPNQIRIWKSEHEMAQSLGVVIDYFIQPIEFISERGRVTGIKCCRTRLSPDLDRDGRQKTEPIPGTDFIIPADMAIVATGLKSSYQKDFSIYKDLSTSIDGIFAGGEWANGAATVVEAVRDGKKAAETIMAYFRTKKL